VTRGLFRLGLAEYWRDLLAYDEQQVELDPARIA
jgi:hypothetical protein